MNWCPKCKEEIQLFATKCPHCLSELDDGEGGLGFFGWILVIVVFCYFFFGMYE
jgi:predicted amidophosphoribosyltransferase